MKHIRNLIESRFLELSNRNDYLIKYTIGGASLRNFKDDININDVIRQASETCLPIILHVHPDYGASSISSEKLYLRDMPDPMDSEF